MKQLLIFLFALVNIAYGQSKPTTAKTRFVNGLYIGTKANNYFKFADSNAIYWSPDSLLMAKYKGLAKSIAFINSLTLNTIPKANGANTLVNSNISDNGTTVTVSSNARVNGLGVNTAPTANSNFRIGGTLTGGVTAGSIINIYAVQSPVTTAGYGYFNQVSTSASSFTLGNLYHYYADQSTFGAGSIVNNQHGFFAEATLTGAAFNYGFRGDIPAGANRWNAFMAGTANNHFNGRTLFNTTVDDGVNQVQVSGNTITSQIITGSFNPNAILRNSSITLSSLYTTVISDNGANYTYTLDAALGHNRIYVIRVIGAGIITLNRSNTDIIYDNAGISQTTINITSASGAVWFQSNGSNYYIQLK